MFAGQQMKSKRTIAEIQKEREAMKEPNGFDLLATLINLLAEQEGVKIQYELVGSEKNEC